MHWLEFLISTGIIVFAGIRLTVFADKLSDELQLGKVWIGIVLLGIVTSLPEAVTSLALIISFNANDLAIGNLLGSNNINPMFIVVMDVMYRQGAVTNAIRPNLSHKVSARYAVYLVAIVIVDILMNSRFPVLHIGPLSSGSFLIAGCYFVGMRKLAKLSTGQSVIFPSRAQEDARKKSVSRIWIQLFINAVLVIVGSIWLAKSADIIAEQTGLGGTFFGTVFLALVTSLPEMVVSLSALRLGSLDLAIGNIFGSNMTNVFILFVSGLFHKGGPVLGAVSGAHTITASLSIVLTVVAIKGIFTRNKKAYFGLGGDSWLMIFFFIFGTSILYFLKP